MTVRQILQWSARLPELLAAGYHVGIEEKPARYFVGVAYGTVGATVIVDRATLEDSPYLIDDVLCSCLDHIGAAVGYSR